MKVLKFGGSSVANATNMSRVLDIVEKIAEEDRVILVCSAISGCTDSLIAMGKENGMEREKMIRPLREKHLKIISRLFTGLQAKAVSEEICAIFDELRNVPGEECETFGELFSTLIIARKLAFEEFQTLWLDSRDLIVKGDLELTYANIAKAVSMHSDVRVFVAPGFIAKDQSGKVTTLGRGGSDYSAALFAAGAGADDLQIWTDVPGIMTTNPKVVPSAVTIPRMSYEAALCMAEHGAKVLYSPTVAPAMNAGIAINIRDTFHPEHPGTVIEKFPPQKVCRWVGISDEGGRLCLTAEGPVDTGASEGRILNTLKESGISALGVSQGAGCILVDVMPAVVRNAVSALHKEFFESARTTVLDVYIAGKGAVGTALEKLILSGNPVKNGKEIRIVEISSDHSFAQRVLENAPRKSVFVDCTDSDDIHCFYVPLLEAGINVVSSNRRSLSVPYVEYAAMKQAALRSGSFFRYGTTVGNALPTLESVSRGATGGEKVESIEAVVSCTLNHIITGYDGANTENFATLLRRAQEAGLTEKDPRTDLGGRDALRKLLILAREAGIPLEEQDVQITPMLGPEYFDCTLDEFYRRLEEAEPEFIRREAELDAIDKRQRFVASLHRDPDSALGYKAEIKIQLYGIQSPFYWISGTENVLEVRSEISAPLVVKGAGEGARGAAAGILNDILK